PALALDRVRTMVGDGSRQLLVRALADAEPAVEVDAAWPLYLEHHREQCIRLCRPYPGAAETLADWRADRRAVAVVTNKPLEFAERILEHLRLRELVGAVVGGDSLPERKPSPEPLLLALRML